MVVLSNSLGATMAMWDGVLPSLRSQWRVLRYDTRGHGGSVVIDERIEIADLAADLLGLLDTLGIARAHVAGLSLGGMTAQALAIGHPGRVASLTLMATSAYMPSEDSWNARAALIRTEGPAAIVDATMGRWFTPGSLASAPGLVAPVREAFLALPPAGYARCAAALGRMDLRPELGLISAPTMVIAGREDPATPVAMADEICGLIPQAELVVLPNAAHLLAVEQATAVGSYLSAFLGRDRS